MIGTVVSVLVLMSITGCEAEMRRSPASPDDLAMVGRAELTISELSVGAVALDAGYRYQVGLSLRNSGTGAALLTKATFVLWFPDGRGTASPPVGQLFPSIHLAAGGTAEASLLDLTDRTHGYATRLTAVIEFTDAAGPHSTSRDLDIAPLPAPGARQSALASSVRVR